MDHSDFNAKLRAAYRARNPVRRNVRLPSDRDIRFSGTVESATLFLSARAVQANMQDDAAAFEAWSLVLFEWCDVQRIVIDWDAPEDTTTGHYQRFLYRLRHFQALLGEATVGIARPDCLSQSRIGIGTVATLNIAGATDSALLPSLPGSEADLEKRLAGGNPAERARLMAMLDLVELDRQMPVGVFDGHPSRAGAIFTHGKSAIDLLGLDRNGGLWLMELKTATNIRVGSLSELFFYAMVLNDARTGRLVFARGTAGKRAAITPAHITAAVRIHARILAEDFHPLLNAALLQKLTAAEAARGSPVDFDLLDLRPCLDPAAVAT